MGFYFLLYIVLVNWILMCFLSFSSQHWVMAMMQAILVFFKIGVEMKKYRASFNTFHMLVTTPVKEYRVYFFAFSDSLKVDYEKGTHLWSYI